MISARGLGARLPDAAARWLFRGLELDARPGEIGVVVGPNGSGKTTLLRCLAGLRSPDAGHVTLANRSLTEIGTRERARLVAVLPQSTPIEDDLQVSDLVMLGRTPHLGRFRAPSRQDHARVADALARVDLHGFGDRRAGTLSGGELQRVMIARMLATEAPTLLLDEPTNGLDIGHALSLLELCRELALTGHCIVMALHDLDLASRYADHAVCLGPGSEHHVGPAEAVLHPDVLEEVFDVRITLDELGLRCRPRRGPS
jgi:ABC-type cobalamin/Fe3+-siderophores transport system ATPase subunit